MSIRFGENGDELNGMSRRSVFQIAQRPGAFEQAETEIDNQNVIAQKKISFSRVHVIYLNSLHCAASWESGISMEGSSLKRWERRPAASGSMPCTQSR